VKRRIAQAAEVDEETRERREIEARPCPDSLCRRRQLSDERRDERERIGRQRALGLDVEDAADLSAGDERHRKLSPDPRQAST
jgi:hypothetical protein